MEKYIITPDDCIILKAFRDSNSLREAALLLNCDPAGLVRRVQSISREYGYLHKVHNRWQVTARGLDLVAWLEESIQSQKALILNKNSIRLASTIWFSESLIIPNLLKLKKRFEQDISFSISSAQKGFEQCLVSGEVDFIIVCHPPENPEIEHRQLMNEKWILIVPSVWKEKLKGSDLENLKHLPFIRHADINEELVIPQIKMAGSGITIDNMIGVRSAVCAGIGWSVVPEILVTREIKERRLIKLSYKISINDRKICVWWLRNRPSSKKVATKICDWINEIYY